jgi:HD-GYP domain-containing protein (c-di-GMP phosphodiesterase class II)
MEHTVLPRRAELLAALSLAIDLGLGQPMEHLLRSCVLGGRLCDLLGLPAERRDRVFYTTLVAWVGCHADSPELTAIFGDDIDFRGATYGVDARGLPRARLMLGHVTYGETPLVRGLQAARFVVTGRRRVDALVRSHWRSARTLCSELGIAGVVGDQLGYLFERWDGKGVPTGAHGEEIPLEMRVVHLTDALEVFLREGGQGAAVAVALERHGTQFDPDLVDLFVTHADEVCAGVGEGDTWALALEQAPDERIGSPAELHEVLTAIGDWADLRSPFTAGHSRAVAELAARAGAMLGLGPGVQDRLDRAGLVHDLGRLGIPSAVWDRAEPLAPADVDRVRLHPFYTGRILSRVPALADLADLAAAHHERLDGSGYPRGAGADALDLPARVLAVADCYQAWREPRPHRPALDDDAAAQRLGREVHAGRLDAAAVEAVLVAAGRPVRRRVAQPAGLTAREVEVLRLLVRGRSAREIAAELVIAPKTARNHTEHIYAKLGVSNRVGATLCAVQHGLVGPDEASAQD